MNVAASLGKYHILGELGKGGFATVYRARDPDLGREVALKVLDPLLTRDPVWVARFRREARAVASLDHPRVVTVHEIGQAEGSLYIAMKLVEGGSLAQRISSQGPLPWVEVLRLAEQIAEALDFAHGQGVLHRDLKPANVLLDPRLGAVLTDFGFASLVADNSLSISMSGGVVGTPAYIAPEVWEGDDPTPQTDIYALGCIVYEMVSGQALFAGNSTPAVMRAHFQPRKLPETWPEGTPQGLTDVLLTALAQEQVSRYAAAGELAVALTGLRMDPLAAPYDELQAAVEGGRWQEALALAGQARSVDGGYRDVTALEAVALAGLEQEARVKQAAGWREEVERALQEGDLKGASLAANKWQEFTPDDPAAAQLQAKLKHDRGLTEAVQLPVEAAHVLAAETTQDARWAIQHRQELAQDDSSQEALRVNEQKPSHQVRPDLVVSPFGGQYTSIQAAIDDAHPGAIIEIHPGTYPGGLDIKKDIHLVGVGPREQIVVEAQYDDVVYFETQRGTVRGLTLRLLNNRLVRYAVDIAKGELLLEDCDITTDRGVVVAIHKGAKPIVRNNRIHDGRHCGILIYDNALGLIESNDICGNAGAGIEVMDGGNPTIRGNRIHGGEHSGIYVHFGGRGILEDNDIEGNTFSGIQVRTGGNPMVIKNRIHGGQTSGVLVSDGGLGTFEDNDICNNALSGIDVRTGGNPTVRHNRICQNADFAVTIYDHGQGTFIDNDLTGNTRGAWSVAGDSIVIKKNNRE